ncbi:MAG: hypothetical protein HAW67_00770, partial [Endozoicomonadaceae bacterium]|nr:hypothetical protein [Endozoicomonadaceae bacterium]
EIIEPEQYGDLSKGIDFIVSTRLSEELKNKHAEDSRVSLLNNDADVQIVETVPNSL